MSALGWDPGRAWPRPCRIDFGLPPDGDLLLFEANATAVIVSPDIDERWTYRRAAINALPEAVVAMMMREAAISPWRRARPNHRTSRSCLRNNHSPCTLLRHAAPGVATNAGSKS
jgi:hypothetical protein